MILLNREMVTEKIATEKGQYFLYSQASFNSESHITIRNYDMNNKNSDEIIILSAEETQAIIRLFKNLKSADCLPF